MNEGDKMQVCRHFSYRNGKFHRCQAFWSGKMLTNLHIITFIQRSIDEENSIMLLTPLSQHMLEMQDVSCTTIRGAFLIDTYAANSWRMEWASVVTEQCMYVTKGESFTLFYCFKDPPWRWKANGGKFWVIHYALYLNEKLCIIFCTRARLCIFSSFTQYLSVNK